MTEWDKMIENGRRRFSVATFVIKDRFRDPNFPVFAPAFYVDAELASKPRNIIFNEFGQIRVDPVDVGGNK